MVATREVQPGELLFREQAVAVGSFHETPPVCLTCLHPVDGSYLCPLCNVPLCGEACGGLAHLECKVFVGLSEGRRVGVSRWGGSDPFYQCTAVLRCLLQREANPTGWAAMLAMMDHNSDRQTANEDHWKVCQHNIVNYLTQTLGLDFTREEVNHVIGLLEVNAFQVTLDAKEVKDVEEKKDEKMKGKVAREGLARGVFPLLAMLNHSCTSNARYISLAGGWMECRATTTIREGEEVTDHYVPPTDDTLSRGSALQAGWHFSCSCSRCGDPREGGALLSAYSCQGLREHGAKGLKEEGEDCRLAEEKEDEGENREPAGEGRNVTEEGEGVCPGMVLADRPPDLLTTFTCTSCGATYSHSQVEEVLGEVYAQLEEAGSHPFQLEQVVASPRLWPTHAAALQAKQRLLYVYGKARVTSTPGHLERKAAFCRELVELFSLVMPGLTRERGLTMYELYITLSQLGREEGELWRLEEAHTCLRHERPGSYEGIVFTDATFLLQKIKAREALKSQRI